MMQFLTAATLSLSLCVTAVPTFAQVLFEEVGSSMGIDHMHLSNDMMGGGVAIFDYDNDGWQDIYLTGGENPDKLLHNQAGQLFVDVSIQSGIEQLTQTTTFGVTTGDIDNDGYRDILITTAAQSESLLLRNLGDGTFVQLSNAISDGQDWKTSASFGDVNADGYLDVYISAYVSQISFETDTAGNVVAFDHECSPNKLFLNNGDLTFTDVSVQYGVANEGCALATAFTDFDNDRDVDLMLANDFGAWVQPSALFQNMFPSPQLNDVSNATGMDLQIYGMGIAIGDYDKDGDLDYYQTNLGRNVLSRNDGGTFTDVTTSANCESDSTGQLLDTGWGTFFFDVDNDSWPDLFVCNGWINAAEMIANVHNDPNVLYLNNGDGTFTDISDESSVASTRHGRGAAFGDLDNDGKLDFVINNVHQDADSTEFEIYHNISDVGNWVAFRLHGVQSNRDAFGSHIELVQNGVPVISEVGGGSSHASQNSSIVHFGLGSETAADSVIVTFPSGTEQVLTNVNANQIVDVYEDIATAAGLADEQESIEALYENGTVTLKTKMAMEVEMSIFDASGRTLLCRSVNLNVGKTPVFALAGLPAGVYLMSLQDAEERQTLRFTVFQ